MGIKDKGSLLFPVFCTGTGVRDEGLGDLLVVEESVKKGLKYFSFTLHPKRPRSTGEDGVKIRHDGEGPSLRWVIKEGGC